MLRGRRYRENRLRLEPSVKYKGQHRSACRAVPGGCGRHFFIRDYRDCRRARAFEKLAGSLPSVLGSAPAFFPCDVAATKGRTETINGIENSRNTPFTFVLLSRPFSRRLPSAFVFFANARNCGRVRERAKWYKVREVVIISTAIKLIYSYLIWCTSKKLIVK